MGGAIFRRCKLKLTGAHTFDGCEGMIEILHAGFDPGVGIGKPLSRRRFGSEVTFHLQKVAVGVPADANFAIGSDVNTVCPEVARPRMFVPD